MGVYPCGREQALPRFVQLLAEFKGLFTALDMGSGQHQLAHPGLVGAVEYGLLLIGKTVIFGGAVAVLLCAFHVAALWMLGGLLLTQIGVTASVMRWLTDNKRTF